MIFVSTIANLKGKQTMKKIAMMLGAAALLPLHADTYQFIISGDPVAAATADSHSVASAATSLEARYRTWDESDGIALRSDKYRGLFIIVR